MQIASGAAKGRNINIPKIVDLKPTKNMVRLAVFNILANKVKGAKVADIFCGSGSLGLEALSLGAAWCDFIDINPRACEAIEKTLKGSLLDSRARVWQKSALQFLEGRPKESYDLIFLDPPYSLTSIVHLLDLCGEVIKKEGVIVFEHHLRFRPKKEYHTSVVVNQRSYGQTTVTFLTKKESDAKNSNA